MVLGPPTTIIIDLYTINNSNPNFGTLFDFVSKVMIRFVRFYFLVILRLSYLSLKVSQIEI